MHQFLEAATIALQAIWTNKLRSLLTVLGNIVAVTSIIAVVSLVPAIGPRGTREVAGVALAVLGLAVAAGALRRWKRVQQAMERGDDLPPSWMPLLLAIGLGVIGVVVAVMVLVAR